MEGLYSRNQGPRAPFIKPEQGNEVVITGMAGKFPDSHDIYHFRDNLFNKVDLVSGDFRRWRPIYPEVPQRTGKLFNINKFDPGFFGVTSTETRAMDPMIRMVLEKTIEAIMDAGHHPSDFENTNTVVFVGCASSETEKFVFSEDLIPTADAIVGCQRSMIAKRISYFLKLKGQSCIMDTACSSSLFAFEQAYTAIKKGQCDKAIVCGTNICLHPIVSQQFARLGVLSADGSCKSFDDGGNGYARSEGIVAILLEKAKDAKRIYCEVVHTKTNCDGYKKQGITFPSSDAQKMLLKDFYDECKIDPTVLTFMEAHGTGTTVGDPEELSTLDEIYCKQRDRPLHIGAIKSNIGHNEPASGLCSIVKVLIAMETGFIPPNLNYEKPRKGVKALEQGKLIVVTEKMPLPDQNGYFAVNNFGFGGGNAHVLLHWNPKTKKNEGISEDNLPRLLCVSGRTDEGVNSILDDFRSKKCDAEYAYLIHQVFRKPIMGYFNRGYAIYDKNGEVKRSLTQVGDIEKQKLYLLFSNFDEEWLKLGPAFMEIPIFTKTIKSIQNILREVGDAAFADVVSDSKEGSQIDQILGTVAIQISLANILKEIKLTPYKIVGIGSGELVAAYADGYLTLKQVVLGLFYIATNLKKVMDWDKLQKMFSTRKNTHEKWIPIHAAKLCQNSAKYFADNIIISSSGRDIEKLLPKNAVSLVVGPVIKEFSSRRIDLIDLESKDYILDFLTGLGKLHQHGFDMELDKLYPPIQLPVGRGTPMLSPLIKWNQQRDCKVYLQQYGVEVKIDYRVTCIISKIEEWRFVVGHSIDGRNLFPATGYLYLACQSLAMATHKLFDEMKIVFEDVKYLRAAHVPKDGSLNLFVNIEIGAKTFEISENGVSIVTGKIYENTVEDDSWDIPILEEKNELSLTEKDIYKELKLRGYQYTGKFRGIRKCSVDAAHAIIEWEENWISFMDCLLQLLILQEDTRSLFIPTGIQRLVIDSRKHFAAAKECGNMIPARLYKDLCTVRCGGIELRGLIANAIPRRKAGDPVLEISKFIRNRTKMNGQDSIRCFVQLVLENANVAKVKVVEVCTENQTEDDLICPIIQKALDDLPLLQQDIVVLAKRLMDLPRITIEDKALDTESNCLILVVTNILESVQTTVANNVVKDVNGFIISKESPQVDLVKFSGSSYTVLCSNSSETETLVLLRPICTSTEKTRYLDLTNALDNLDSWIPKLQNLLKENKKVLLYAQGDELCGILGLITCLRRESYGNKIFCVFIMDDAPKFDPQLEFYKEQLDKGFAFNIWKDGAWGTYRHLLLPETQSVETEHCYVNVTTRGDLSTLSWLEGSVDPTETIPEDEQIVHIYYAALNFRDLMTASGKLPPEVITRDRIEIECVQGFEFAGRNLKGERVVGMGISGALATMVQCKELLHRIPDHWSMEDAATVTVVYGTVMETLVNRGNLKAGQTILIHSGTGGIGQAAINLSLYYGLTVFVTVGTSEKREFLEQQYPQIKKEHIFNSRDTFFEEMIHKYTNGRGVDIVLNSLSEEKLLASIRCLARGGKFLEIGKFDLASNNALALQLLEKEAQFISVALDQHVSSKETTMYTYKQQMQGLIDCGAVKPLPRTVFQSNELEDAFRYMGAGEHIGKVLVKIRDEEDQKVCHVPKTLFRAMPRFNCKPRCSYLICGGLGGFGMELADLLVIRGAKKLVLTSRSGLSNGYQKFRIRMWQNYGVKVVTSSADASTEAECTELLNMANEMGPVDGIFNLAVVLKDALFENLSVEDFKVAVVPKAICTKNLDSISRRLCPNLRYFVVFSSMSCGRGNIGQANYGMANSVMERICEKRKREGYPAVAIQWGAIGEVGLVAKMQEDHRELVIGGTLQQRISSCLQVMDKFIAQNEPVVGSMLVAEKRYGGHAGNLFDAVTNILGIINLKSVGLHTPFPDLGMDSMTAIEIKQVLEREYEVFLTAQDIRGMTLTKLKDLANKQDSADIATTTLDIAVEDIPTDAKLLLRIIGNEEFATTPIIKLKALIQEYEDGPHVIALPGVEGMAAIFESLSMKLKAHVSCLQFCTNYKADTIKKLAEYIVPLVEPFSGKLILLAYSFGTMVAMELLRILETKGKTVKVIFIDGSPDLMVEMVNAHVPIDDDNLFHTVMIFMVMSRYMSYNDIVKQQDVLMKLSTYQEKIDYLLSVSPKVETSRAHILNMYASIYDRLVSLKSYQYDGTATEELKSPVTLFKAKSSSVQKTDPDYGLSKIFRGGVKVVTIEGDHVTILESDDLANKINMVLQDIE